MPKSSMDWLGVISLWLGAVVIALKSGELPLPSWAPSWLASPWWAIAPLVLVTASVVLFIVRESKLFKPTYYPDQYHPTSTLAPEPIPQKDDDTDSDQDGVTIGCGPIVSTVAVVILVILLIVGSIAVRRRLTAEPLPTPPPVLQGPISAASVAETIKTKSAVEAEALLTRYLGQPMRATGRIFSTRDERGFRLYVLTLTDPEQMPQVYLKFEGQSGLSSYRKQDHVAANCKIERLDATGIGLNQCVLIEAPDPD